MPRGSNRGRAATQLRSRAEDYETAYRRAALRLFGRERAEVASALARAAETGGDRAIQAALRAIERAYTTADGKYHVRWLESYTELHGATFRLVGRDLVGGSGFRFDLVNDAVLDAARDRADRLAGFIGRTSADRVTKHVVRAIRGGDLADLRTAIRDRAFGEEITLARAEAIARTETIGAMNEGEYVSAVESGVFAEKEWLHSGNPRNPREWHEEMDGERVGIEDEFSNGLLHPHAEGAPAEEVVNCGCGVLYHS